MSKIGKALKNLGQFLTGWDTAVENAKPVTLPVEEQKANATTIVSTKPVVAKARPKAKSTPITQYCVLSYKRVTLSKPMSKQAATALAKKINQEQKIGVIIFQIPEK